MSGSQAPELLIQLIWSKPGHQTVKSSPDGSNIQPGLRATAVNILFQTAFLALPHICKQTSLSTGKTVQDILLLKAFNDSITLPRCCLDSAWHKSSCLEISSLPASLPSFSSSHSLHMTSTLQSDWTLRSSRKAPSSITLALGYTFPSAGKSLSAGTAPTS